MCQTSDQHRKARTAAVNQKLLLPAEIAEQLTAQ
jgi:hypothetical protein